MYVKDTPAAVEQEITVEKRERVSFDNLLLGHERKVEKSADVAEFEFKDGMLRRVDPMIVLDSPKPEDATRDPQHPASNFPRGHVPFAGDGHGNPIVAVPKPYDIHGAGTMTPHCLNFETPGKDGGQKEPEMYRPSVPGRDPADGPKAVRFGNGYVLKSEFAADDESEG